MRNWFIIAIVVVVVPIFTLSMLIFSTRESTYIIENPTQEQVLQLTKADPQGRVWFEDTALVYQGSLLVKFVFSTRYFEIEKGRLFLDKAGVNYQLVKTTK